MARRPERRGQRRGLRRPFVKGGCVAAVALVAGVSIYSANSSGSPAYRTATVTTSTVTKTLNVSGTLEPVNDATVTFQVAGTVSSVAVSTGQHVNAGQVLASIDPSTLQEAFTAAQTSLAADQARLSEDEAGQTTTASSVTGSAATTTSASTGVDAITLTAAPTPSTTAALQAAQKAVVNAQQKADSDSQIAAADLADAETTCSATGSTTTGGGVSTTASTTPTPGTTTPTSAPTTTPPTTGGAGPSEACTTALNTAMNAQSQVSSDQKAVSTAETALAKLLSSAASSVATPTSGGAGTPGPASPGGSSASTGKSAGGSSASSGAGGGAKSSATSGSGASTGSGSPQTVTNRAAQLATDQATIDSAEATLVGDQQSLADAQLTSPIAGMVAAIGVSTGQSVSAGSTSDTITVINAGGYQTTSSLTSTQVSQVTVGDQVQVAVNGTSGTLAGSVSRVGPVSMSSSSDTYPVIVAIDGGKSTMSAGSTAAVDIDVAKATNALVVPTSAVHTTSPGRSYVFVLQAGTEKQTEVSVGVTGDIYTQITSGLSRGETVVLADPSQAVPSSNTNTTGPTFGGAGGFPGGGARTNTATGVTA